MPNFYRSFEEAYRLIRLGLEEDVYPDCDGQDDEDFQRCVTKEEEP